MVIQVNIYMTDVFSFRVKIIRSVCLKRWPGNIKVYFKGNERNTTILSELVLLLEAQAAIKEIGFGRSTSIISIKFLQTCYFEFIFFP